jgi:thiamine-phosphate diphosphorylase
MITDRHRLQGTASSRSGRPGGEDVLVQRVAAAARAGVDLIQVRERDLEGGRLFHLVRRCVEAVRATHARVIVNDRLDVALSAGAHGVHLRGDSMPVTRARTSVPPGFIVGRSIHSRAEAISLSSAGGLDYMIFGPVFPTTSKPGQAATGVHALADIVAATAIPVLAIGGVTLDTIPAVTTSGAAGVAAIGFFAIDDEQKMQANVSRASRV